MLNYIEWISLRILIITSNDWALAGGICLQLVERLTAPIVFVDVKDVPKFDDKKCKLVFLFGLLGTVKLLLLSWRNKFKLRHLAKKGKVEIIHCKRLEIDNGKIIFQSDRCVLINYPWLFDADLYKGTLNCHPSPLPSFSGLMPICHSVHETLSEGVVKTGATVHEINEEIYCGVVRWQEIVLHANHSSMYSIYRNTYRVFSDGIINSLEDGGGRILEKGQYYKAMNWPTVFRMKRSLLLNKPFVKFLLSGGLVGALSWVLQLIIYYFLEMFSITEGYTVAISVWLTFSVIIFVNYFMIKRYVFQRPGNWWRFFAATTFMIWLVGLLAQMVPDLISTFELTLNAAFYYPLSALTLAPISYVIKKHMVF
jgi:hypothetical protein